MRILISGATGFIGSTLVNDLIANGQSPIALVRHSNDQRNHPVRENNAVPKNDPGQKNTAAPKNYETRAIDDLSNCEQWSAETWDRLLSGVDVVIHLAARVHQMQDSAIDPLTAFRSVNTNPTLALARAAAARGVQRFIFLSSIKVNGEATSPGESFTVDSPAGPADPYAVSKWEAELGLEKIATDSEMAVVTVRPPMVYGPGAKGNVPRLAAAIRKGIPLPLGAIHNQRSLLSVHNLVDCFHYLLMHPEPPAYSLTLVADTESPSTPALIQALATAQGRKPRIFPVPVSLLKLGGRLTGKKQEISRLTESLKVTAGSTIPDFSWQAPLRFNDEIRDI